ncbi:MAG TPA: DUF2125 domain-containing protein [Mesorhizobium sp.]|jgi:hypothetical protein|nr:DUF2125 domain-containing protein [Mesorhizobium sp.]
MTSSEQSLSVPDRRYSRRILWLAAFVVILFGGYSLAWFWAAGELEARADAVLARLGERGVEAECAGLAARGFPFRIGLFCEETLYRDTERGVEVSAGAFRSAAQVYNPFRIVSELDGPARVELPDAPPLDLEWEVLKASARVDEPLPERASAEARRFAVASDGSPILQADDVQGHMRMNGTDLDLAWSFRGLVLDESLLDGGALPPLDGAGDGVIANGADVARNGLRGHSGTIRSVRISAGEDASVIVSGPFSVEEDGLLNAQLTLRATNPARLSEVLGQALPEQAGQIQAALGSGLLGSEPTIPITIDRGQARLAFIPLGEIPPLR